MGGLAWGRVPEGRHALKYSLVFTQVPTEQQVGPVKPLPPHCAYAAEHCNTRAG